MTTPAAAAVFDRNSPLTRRASDQALMPVLRIEMAIADAPDRYQPSTCTGSMLST
jgi:hypothetical protein